MELKGLHFSVLLIALLFISSQVLVKADENTNGQAKGNGNGGGDQEPQMAQPLGLGSGGRLKAPKSSCLLCSWRKNNKQCCGFRCCSQEEFDLYAKGGLP